MINFKKQAINVASSTLSAVALIGALAFAAPAKADHNNGNLIGALVFGLIINEALDNNRDNRRHNDYIRHDRRGDRGYNNRYNQPRRPNYTPGYDDARRVCTVETVRRTRDFSVVVELNCYGDIMSKRKIWR